VCLDRPIAVLTGAVRRSQGLDEVSTAILGGAAAENVEFS